MTYRIQKIKNPQKLKGVTFDEIYKVAKRNKLTKTVEHLDKLNVLLGKFPPNIVSNISSMLGPTLPRHKQSQFGRRRHSNY